MLGMKKLPWIFLFSFITLFCRARVVPAQETPFLSHDEIRMLINEISGDRAYDARSLADPLGSGARVGRVLRGRRLLREGGKGRRPRRCEVHRATDEGLRSGLQRSLGGALDGRAGRGEAGRHRGSRALSRHQQLRRRRHGGAGVDWRWFRGGSRGSRRSRQDGSHIGSTGSGGKKRGVEKRCRRSRFLSHQQRQEPFGPSRPDCMGQNSTAVERTRRVHSPSSSRLAELGKRFAISWRWMGSRICSVPGKKTKGGRIVRQGKGGHRV